MTTISQFNFIDPASKPPGTAKHWTKVDGGGKSYKHRQATHDIYNLREQPVSEFNTDVAGFGIQQWPSAEKDFVDDDAVRGQYYADTEAVLRANCDALASNTSTGNKVRKVVIFDHTIRRRHPGSPRGPVQQVHVDQTPAAAAARVRRHLPHDEAEELLKHRFQLINVWRPISHPASDYPLAVIDWRSTTPEDFFAVNLLYPKRADSVMDDDDRGKESLPAETNVEHLTDGYEVRGETMGVAPSDGHRFYYVKDMTPEEVLLLKCYDSWGEGEPNGKRGLALRTPHTAFEDPNTPADAKPRESIEVRALVFYED
ncbi:methyltransferase [Xylaria arbuscula]|nr:methyltransferase [Xylaria arbuscula]